MSTKRQQHRAPPQRRQTTAGPLPSTASCGCCAYLKWALRGMSQTCFDSPGSTNRPGKESIVSWGLAAASRCLNLPPTASRLPTVLTASPSTYPSGSFKHRQLEVCVLWTFSPPGSQRRRLLASGGTNPAIRTLFYRLVRLLGTPTEPVFVFDGPRKPKFKRNKRSWRGDSVATAQAKRLIRLFGFVVHDAPGEAEAECAFLQKNGIVDAVLSEDVDTIMFGCTKTLRNWSTESKSSSTPTHVSLYDLKEMSMTDLGLDREGMVLVALMSGGDYLPEGIPGCGVKVAREAALAGFGKSICRLKISDRDGLRAWRESLIHELRTNEKGYFRTKHKALTVPDNFPNLEVLRFYTHPVVSQESRIETLRQQLTEQRDMHLVDLREFTRETFDWDFRIGAVKFVRVLCQALLVHNICQERDAGHHFVKRISGRRQHSSTDGTPELRLTFVPSEVVPIDLSKEEEGSTSVGRSGLALNSNDEFGAAAEETVAAEESRTLVGRDFDVRKPELAWVLEGVARKSVPQAVQAWEEGELAKAVRKAAMKKKASIMGSAKTAGMVSGALDEFVRVTKMIRTSHDACKSLDSHPQQHSQLQGHHQCPPKYTRFCPPPPPLPLGTSKQQSSRRAAKPRISQRVESSPVMPRPSKPASLPEAILISSSPAEPTPQSPAAPLAGARAHLPSSLLDGEEGSCPVYPTVASTGSPQKLSHGSGASRRRGAASRAPSALGSSPTSKTLKQSSLDRFLINTVGQHGRAGASRDRGLPPAAISVTGPREAKNAEVMSGGEEDDDVSGLKVLSWPVFPGHITPGKEKQKGESPRSQQQPKPVFGSTAVPGKKKLIVPRAAALGFFEELDIEADEHGARQACETTTRRGRVSSSAALRESDIPVIDLTVHP